MNAGQLQAVAGWAALSDRDATALAAMGVDRWFRPGAVVSEAHNADGAPLLIVAGEAKLLLEVGELSLPIATLGPGDWCNVDAASERVAAPFSVRALTDLKALLVPREQFAELHSRPSSMGRQLLASLLAAQLRIGEQLAPHAARWQQAAAAKRKPTRKDILELGMVKLIAPTQSGDARSQNQVELIGHQGTAVSAAFRQNR